MKSIAAILFSISLSLAQDLRVTVKVYPPEKTPANSSFFIAGNQSSLGDWDPKRIPLERSTDGSWVKTFSFPNATRIEFKITRGGWNTQALYQYGVIPGNSIAELTTDTTIVVKPLSWSDLEAKSGGKISGIVEYLRDLSGVGLNYLRDAIVWLPPSYDKDNTRRYPVLYMHDGQNVFDPSTSFIGVDWQADETADSLIRQNRLQELIIVAIANSPDRFAEYSDTDLGKAYARFVIDSVKSRIDKAFRTLSDAGSTGVMGSSMGGLISFLFVWWHPDVFAKAGCLSSVFTRGRTEILNTVSAFDGPRKPLRLYFDCGGAGGDETLMSGMDEMTEVLAKKGYRKGSDFISFYDEKAEHNERAWARRLWRPLIFLFGTTHDPTSLHGSGRKR